MARKETAKPEPAAPRELSAQEKVAAILDLLGHDINKVVSLRIEAGVGELTRVQIEYLLTDRPVPPSVVTQRKDNA